MTRRQVKAAFEIYKEVFSDKVVMGNVLGILSEIVSRQHSETELVNPFITMGELLAVPNFWNDERLLKMIIDAFQSRAFRGCAQMAGFSLNDPAEMITMRAALKQTDKQRDKIYSEVAHHARMMFGSQQVDKIAADELVKKWNERVEKALKELTL